MEQGVDVRGLTRRFAGIPVIGQTEPKIHNEIVIKLF